MQIIKGNLINLALSGEAKIIVHGCNCFHAMGSGIAGALAQRFPEIPMADFGTERGSVQKLTTYSVAKVTQELIKPYVSKRVTPFTCLNLYTQYRPGKDFLPSLFPKALQGLNREFKGQTLWFPLIGCGIAGADWTYVMTQMVEHLKDVDTRVVIL